MRISLRLTQDHLQVLRDASHRHGRPRDGLQSHTDSERKLSTQREKRNQTHSHLHTYTPTHTYTYTYTHTHTHTHTQRMREKEEKKALPAAKRVRQHHWVAALPLHFVHNKNHRQPRAEQRFAHAVAQENVLFCSFSLSRHGMQSKGVVHQQYLVSRLNWMRALSR